MPKTEAAIRAGLEAGDPAVLADLVLYAEHEIPGNGAEIVLRVASAQYSSAVEALAQTAPNAGGAAARAVVLGARVGMPLLSGAFCRLLRLDDAEIVIAVIQEVGQMIAPLIADLNGSAPSAQQQDILLRAAAKDAVVRLSTTGAWATLAEVAVETVFLAAGPLGILYQGPVTTVEELRHAIRSDHERALSLQIGARERTHARWLRASEPIEKLNLLFAGILKQYCIA